MSELSRMPDLLRSLKMEKKALMPFFSNFLILKMSKKMKMIWVILMRNLKTKDQTWMGTPEKMEAKIKEKMETKMLKLSTRRRERRMNWNLKLEYSSQLVTEMLIKMSS